MSTISHVILVGHCGPDSHLLKSAVSRALDGVDIVSADDQQTLEQYDNAQSLWLVNRVLDYGFDTTQGLDIIRQHADKDDGPRVMLISNYEDAQQEAEEAGALPGFGKAETNRPETAEKLRAAAGLE